MVIGDLILRAAQAELLFGDSLLLLPLGLLLFPERLVGEARGDLRCLQLLFEGGEIGGQLGLLCGDVCLCCDELHSSPGHKNYERSGLGRIDADFRDEAHIGIGIIGKLLTRSICVRVS